jgi:flagellin
MTISFRSNLLSTNAITQLGKTSRALATSYERLSTGQRINSANDDAGGIAVADSLRAQTRLASIAVRNANDGISAIQIADGSMEAISSLLVRMAELAEQSANGAYSVAQRSGLAAEFLAIGSEVQRIAKTTEFNELSLLSDSSNISIQVGFDNTANSRIEIAAVLATLEELGIGNAAGALTFSINGTTEVFAKAAAGSALNAVNDAIATLSQNRGLFGAAETRLVAAIQVLEVAAENFNAAESRIRDIDVAEETAKLTRNQILQQAATAVLAQANQQPLLVLSLLQ